MHNITSHTLKGLKNARNVFESRVWDVRLDRGFMEFVRAG